MKLRYALPFVAAAGVLVALSACQSTLPGGSGTNPPPTTSASCASPAALPTSIDTATTLKAGCYEPANDVSVNAALVLSPGVTILMPSNTSITVDTGGSLSAVGDPSNGITIEGDGSLAPWGDLNFYTSSPANVLSYVTVSGGGSQNDGEVFVGSTASVSISHAKIENSAAYGVYVADDGLPFPAFASNRITLNTLGAMRIPASVMPSLDPASDYSGNSDDVVAVDGATNVTPMPGHSGALTWPALNVPYAVKSGFTVYTDVVVADGVTMRFDAGEALTVDTNASSSGSLKAVGGTKGIVFEGDKNNDPWGDINFYTSSPNNVLSNVTVNYGGSPGDGDVFIGSGAAAQVLHSRLENSQGFGICNHGTLTTFLPPDTSDTNTYLHDPLGSVNTSPSGC